ncbi:hypothetical protein NDU88_002418 [Pleurodeles waltl]|uniref:Uncharacterized protein n=1 Tax=Pleurodeles waltl TaxID=8319 RepID=A0AAV7SF52_PLEWA|nr:hypothetical protein NDU88_002418 [Pleurodeles waltl]
MGCSFAGVGGTLPGLTGDPFDPLGVAVSTVDAALVAEVLAWDLDTLARGEGRGGGVGKRSTLARKSFLDTLGWEDGDGLGVEEEGVVVGGVCLLSLGEGAWAGCCCEVDGCWVGGGLRLCTLGGGITDTLGEDTGDVCMVVGVVTASEGCVVMGMLVMEVVDEDVVHAGVRGDETGREVDEEEEGDTVEQWMLVCLHGHGACVSACEMRCGAYVCLSHFCVLIWMNAGLKVWLGYAEVEGIGTG